MRSSIERMLLDCKSETCVEAGNPIAADDAIVKVFKRHAFSASLAVADKLIDRRTVDEMHSRLQGLDDIGVELFAFGAMGMIVLSSDMRIDRSHLVGTTPRPGTVPASGSSSKRPAQSSGQFWCQCNTARSAETTHNACLRFFRHDCRCEARAQCDGTSKAT